MNKQQEENQIKYDFYNDSKFLIETIKGEFNRMCVCETASELGRMNNYIRENLDKLFNMKLKELIKLEELKDSDKYSPEEYFETFGNDISQR